jgi:hypothetical protein
MCARGRKKDFAFSLFTPKWSLSLRLLHMMSRRRRLEKGRMRDKSLYLIVTNCRTLCHAPHTCTYFSRSPFQRVIRIFRLGRYTDGGSLLRETLRASSAAVGLMFFFMTILTLLLASIVYFAEMGQFKVTPVGKIFLTPSPLPSLRMWAVTFV